MTLDLTGTIGDDYGEALAIANRILAIRATDLYLQDISDDEMNKLTPHLGRHESIDHAYDLCIEAYEKWCARCARIQMWDLTDGSRPGFIYVIKAGPYYKIGRSNKAERRIAQLGIQLPWPVEIVMTAEVPDMVRLERELHAFFASQRLNGEWFELSDDDIHLIRTRLA